MRKYVPGSDHSSSLPQKRSTTKVTLEHNSSSVSRDYPPHPRHISTTPRTGSHSSCHQRRLCHDLQQPPPRTARSRTNELPVQSKIRHQHRSAIATPPASISLFALVPTTPSNTSNCSSTGPNCKLRRKISRSQPCFPRWSIQHGYKEERRGRFRAAFQTSEECTQYLLHHIAYNHLGALFKNILLLYSVRAAQ